MTNSRDTFNYHFKSSEIEMGVEEMLVSISRDHHTNGICNVLAPHWPTKERRAVTPDLQPPRDFGLFETAPCYCCECDGGL